MRVVIYYNRNNSINSLFVIKQNADNSLLQRLDQLEVLVDDMNNKEDSTHVSVTAFATTVRNYNTGDHILFDGIVRNYGSSYFMENSTFVCPVDGFYLFSVSILAGWYQQLTIEYGMGAK